MTKVSYIQKGSGKDIVFLHGYLSCKETFIYQINFLSNFFKVTAFDFIGFGKSPNLNEPLDVEGYARHTRSFLKSVGVDRAHFIAHSFGGRVAIKLCALYPDMIDRLILTGSAGLKPKFSIIKKLKILKYKLIKKYLSNEKRAKYGSSDYKKLSPIMKQSFIKIILEDLQKHLKDIDCKTLIICGNKDRETPPYMAKRFKSGIKNSTLYIFKGAGHFAFIDFPCKFNQLAYNFLTK